MTILFRSIQKRRNQDLCPHFHQRLKCASLINSERPCTPLVPSNSHQNTPSSNCTQKYMQNNMALFTCTCFTQERNQFCTFVIFLYVLPVVYSGYLCDKCEKVFTYSIFINLRSQVIISNNLLVLGFQCFLQQSFICN